MDIVKRLYEPFHMHDSVVMKEAAEEIKRLRGELEEAKVTRGNGVLVPSDELKRMQKQLAAANQRIAELERDAARYQWLRDSDYQTYPAVFKACQAWNTLRSKTLDIEIDKAMGGA